MIERIKELKIKNFRGFKGEHVFNLDADIILLSGKNGVGKSTIIYALDRLLNGYSKNGILSSIGENISFIGSNDSFEIQINGKNGVINNKDEFFTSKDDAYSRLYELSSIFYQEYFNDIGLEDILKILSGDLASIKLRPLLNDIKNSFILELKSEYLPSTINLFERRREFFIRWKELIEEIKKYELFKDIKQNFSFENKGIPNYIERQFYNFLVDISKKFNSNKNYEKIDKGDLLEILRNLRDLFNEFTSKIEKDIFDSDMLNNLHKFYNRRVVKYDGKINIADERRNLYLMLNNHQLQTLEKRLNDKKIELEKLNKEIEKIENSLKKWSIPGQPSFDEALDIFFLYKKNAIDLKDIYYPTEVVLWLNKVSENIEELRKSFNLWREKLKNIKEQKEKDKDSLTQHIHFLSEHINFNKLIIKSDLKKEIQERLKVSENVLLEDVLGEKITEHKNTYIITEIISLLDFQIQKEKDLKEEYDLQKKNSETVKKIEEIINYTEKIIKKEMGKNSVILSNTETIPENKLKELTYTLNSILRFFHFPSEFLDIKIVNSGTKLKPNYIFTTSKGKELNFDNFSTGQKTQLAIAWTIGLNYLLSRKLPHKVIIFDDVTTSLDLAQLIPASILFRKMAYSDINNRQVVISSHHDDLTNRLVDFLMPPPEKKLKVIYFEDWSLEKGPKFKEYLVKGKDLNENLSGFYAEKLKELKNYLEDNYVL
ncbi:MAG: ATP-binding protein [Desulfonauticus sp.]|nr:ATP-binding protein [Desulfonauticus sp.]